MLIIARTTGGRRDGMNKVTLKLRMVHELLNHFVTECWRRRL